MGFILSPEPDIVTSVFDCPRGKSPRMRASVVSKIYDKTRQHHYIHGVYKSILRALINVMGSVKYLNSENQIVDVKSFHGRQERAIAKLLKENNLVLPVIAVAQVGTNNADERRRYEPNLVHEVWWDEDAQRAKRVLSLAPVPVTINYAVSVWSKYVEDMDQIIEQIRTFFNPCLELATPESTLIKSFIEDESDDSDFIAGDGADRILRKKVTVKVETFLPSPKFLFTNTGEIEELNLDTCVYD